MAYLDSSIDAVEGLPVEKLKKAIEEATSQVMKFPVEKPLALITHILFDMDGLLLDTEILYTKAQQKLLDPFGIKFDQTVKNMMMGRKALEAVEIMVIFHS